MDSEESGEEIECVICNQSYTSSPIALVASAQATSGKAYVVLSLFIRIHRDCSNVNKFRISPRGHVQGGARFSFALCRPITH